MRKKIYFIVNLISQKKFMRLKKEISSQASKHSVDYEILRSTYRGHAITGRFFTRFLTILNEDPPGPIIIPALIAVRGVSLDPNVFSTSYRDKRWFEILCLSLGRIPPM